MPSESVKKQKDPGNDRMSDTSTPWSRRSACAVAALSTRILIAAVSTPTTAPLLAGTRLRGGAAASARGAASFAAESITTARAAGATGPLHRLAGDQPVPGSRKKTTAEPSARTKPLASPLPWRGDALRNATASCSPVGPGNSRNCHVWVVLLPRLPGSR